MTLEDGTGGSKVTELLRNCFGNLNKNTFEFSDAPYCVRGVFTYQDVCVCECGHLNRFGPMNFGQKPFLLSLLVSHSTAIASSKHI